MSFCLKDGRGWGHGRGRYRGWAGLPAAQGRWREGAGGGGKSWRGEAGEGGDPPQQRVPALVSRQTTESELETRHPEPRGIRA